MWNGLLHLISSPQQPVWCNAPTASSLPQDIYKVVVKHRKTFGMCTNVYAIPAFPSLITLLKVCHMGPFPVQESLLHFLHFRQEEQSQRSFFGSFFVFVFRKGHSLELEIARKPIQWVKDPKKACDLILMRFHHLIVMRWRQKAKTADSNGVNVFLRKVMNKARFRCRSTHALNLTDGWINLVRQF